MTSDIWQKIALFLPIFLIACRSGSSDGPEGNVYVVNDSLGARQEMKELIAPYRKKLERSMSEELGYSLQKLETAEPEGKLGNFVADLVLERSQALIKNEEPERVHMAVLNNGGLRTPLPKGPIEKGRIYRLMPFENEVELLKMRSSAMRELFSYLAETPQPIAGGELVKRGNEIERIRVQGRALDSEKAYWVATSNFLAEGGDGMNFFQKATDRVSTGIKVRDMIIDRIQAIDEAGDSISIAKDGRIEELEEKTVR